MLRQAQTVLAVDTNGRGLVDVTRLARTWVQASGIADGLLTVFLRHTSASLVVQENADPDVRADLERWFARLVPDGDALFVHRDEGPDDMPAHVRAALTATQLSIPVSGGSARARDVAGDLSVGAPPATASTRACAASDRRVNQVASATDRPGRVRIHSVTAIVRFSRFHAMPFKNAA